MTKSSINLGGSLYVSDVKELVIWLPGNGHPMLTPHFSVDDLMTSVQK